MKFGRSAFRLKRFRSAWAAALGAAALALSAASGFAAMAPQSLSALAPVGGEVTVDADWFFFTGTNPRITGAEFSTTEYYSTHEIIEGVLFVQVKTAEELNALPSPPPGRFEVEATVTMANDEGRTATGTITFQTEYQRDAPATLPPDELPDPTFSVTQVRTLPPGVMRSAQAALSFANAGTNPRITGAEFSTTEWYNVHEIREGILYVQPKTAAELSALPAPPPSTFTVDVTVTMANDEGRTASGTITFRTTYDRVSQPKQRVTPTLSAPGTYLANPGYLNSLTADFLFDNAGTNPRITGAEFSTTEYYKDHSVGRGRLWVQAMTAAELNALPAPPPSPFTVDVAVSMTNDESQTASGTVTLETTYERVEPSQEPTEPSGPEPTFTRTAPINAHPGTVVEVWVRAAFDNPGTNPRFTDVTFSTTEYYSSHYIYTYAASEHTGGPSLYITAKTHAELNALATPPPNPFTVTADVTMTNDEGHTATGTLTFQTSYITASGSDSTPVPADAVTRELPAGAGRKYEILPLFPLGGTNPGLTSMVFSSTEYYSMHDYSSGRRHGRPELYVTAKTSEELNALATPPPTPFTVTVDVTLTNDEGETVSGTIAFTTTYIRTETEEVTPAPTFSVTGTRTASPGFQINVGADEAFANAGTNPRITDAVFSTTEYYDLHRVTGGRLWIGVKTAAELNALSPPPPSPFTVDVTVTMTNDEGQTASGTIKVETTYERALTSTPAPGQTPTRGEPVGPPQ